jgi:four helix bundle protein
MTTKSYRDLDIYKLAHELGVTLHKFSLKMPKHELYETGSQLRRASKSISANIVEGYGRRRYKAEFIRFLIFAQASCDETTEWLEYIHDCYKDLKEEADQLLSMTDELGKKINRFIQAVESKHKV